MKLCDLLMKPLNWKRCFLEINTNLEAFYVAKSQY